MFPPEFWFELARREAVHYSPRNRPIRWGKYIMAFVYDARDKDIGKRLREKNPNPHGEWTLESLAARIPGAATKTHTHLGHYKLTLSHIVSF